MFIKKTPESSKVPTIDNLGVLQVCEILTGIKMHSIEYECNELEWKSNSRHNLLRLEKVRTTSRLLRQIYSRQSKFRWLLNLFLSDNLGAVSIWRCYLYSVWIIYIKIRRSHDRFIFIIEILIPGKTLFIPRPLKNTENRIRWVYPKSVCFWSLIVRCYATWSKTVSRMQGFAAMQLFAQRMHCDATGYKTAKWFQIVVLWSVTPYSVSKTNP